MSEFSDEMAACALELLTEFGEEIMLTVTTPGAYNPATGSTATGTDAVAVGYGAPTDYDDVEIDGTMVQRGDVRLYINSVTTEPEPGAEITLGTRDYRVITVRRYTINSADVLYELQLRI